jgi:phosphoribosyl 1,2-cyclic phosphate phosphodiesterase
MSGSCRARILGCGAAPGVPRIGNHWGACDPTNPRNRRTRTSLLIERFGAGSTPTRVLIDTGPDVRAQLLAADVDSLDAVIYTHAHADHTHGIDELRAVSQNAGRLIDVFATPRTAASLTKTFGYCFVQRPGSINPPTLKMHELEAGAPLTIDGPGGGLTLLPLRQIHGETEVLCLRVGGLAYSCDVSDIPADTAQALAGLDLWIVDALRDGPHPNHFCVADALGWIERLRPKRAILTHMSNELDYEALKARLPHNVEPAYDGMTIAFAGA